MSISRHSASRIKRPKRGYTLTEVLVATAMAGIVLGGAITMFNQGVDVSYVATQRGEMQQNARVAINLLSRDLTSAGTGVSTGGIQLPAGAGSLPIRIGCDMTLTCYVNVAGTAITYASTCAPPTCPTSRMFAINPGDGLGPTINGAATDTVTIVYKDANYPALVGATAAGPLDQLNLAALSKTGDLASFAAGTLPPIDDVQFGLNVGDMLMVTNFHGSALGTVTAVNGVTRQVSMLGAADPLRFNQPAAALGNISGLANTPGAGDYPIATTAFRAIVVTYYIDASNIINPRLMRQVNALTPVPVAENIENLQITYDIYDDNTGIARSNLPNPSVAPTNASPNQIRKVNISIGARSASQRLVGRGFQRLTMATAVSPRNLSFRDRYQ